MRQRVHGVIVDASHGARGNHCVNDSFFGGLHGGFKKRVHFVIGKHGHGLGLGLKICMWVCGRECYEDIARAVAGDAAIAPQAQGDAFGDAVQLHG